MVSAEPSIVAHSARTSVYDLHVPFNHFLKFHAIRWDHDEDTRKSVEYVMHTLRDSKSVAAYRPRRRYIPNHVTIGSVTFRDKRFATPDFWIGLSGFPPTRLLRILFNFCLCIHLLKILYPSQKSDLQPITVYSKFAENFATPKQCSKWIITLWGVLPAAEQQ